MNNISFAFIFALLIAGGTIGAAYMDKLYTAHVIEVGETTVTVTEAGAIAACRDMAASPMVIDFGGVQPDSPCGKLLGL